MTLYHCGIPMICADSNTTGYWPYMPHRCAVCGAVRYGKVGNYDAERRKAMTESYDSTQDTLDHIETVRGYIFQVNADLVMRGAVHDQSKLQSPEKEMHDRINPRLRHADYGSDEYKAAIADMGDVPAHHYAMNRHHPEHFTDGINGMNLIDLIEMMCDWRAATDRAGGDWAESFAINVARFGISPQLATVLANTARDLGWND